MQEIENKSSFKFFYSNELKGLDKVVSLKVSDSNIDSTLKQLFSDSEISYQKQDNNIILLIPKKAGLTQEGKITGIIKDEQGEPVMGAIIRVKGSATATVTDADGKYLIDAAPGSVLQVSFVGFSQEEITVGAQQYVDLTLQEDSKLLDEVVVVGYGVQKKRDLTGAVSSIKMDDSPVGTLSTVSHALAGKAAGLRVTQSTAQPGAGATFRIRGETSINAGNAPLVIIDGFPVSSSPSPGGASGSYQNNAGSQDNVLEMLNPNDVESIEVLKDASATAIYGARAGHGVILVTTKRGKEGKTNVTYSGNMAVSSMASQYELMNAQEYMKTSNAWKLEKWRKDHADGAYAGYATPVAKPYEYTPMYTDAEIANAKNTDWINEITRTGYQQSHNVSLTGGNEKGRYLASLNYFDQQGVVKNSNMNRLTMNLNSDYEFSKYVKAGFSVNISRNYYDNVPLGTGENEGSGLIASSAFFEPNIPVRDENGDYSISKIYNLRPNPVSLLDIKDNTTKDRVLASSYLQVEPIKNLFLKTNMGFDRRSAKRKAYYPSTIVGRDKSKNGIGHQVQDDGLDYLINFTANYVKTVGNHSITALAGYEFQRITSEWVRAGNTNFPIDAFEYNNLGAGSGDKDVASSATERAIASVFGRINYSYASKYLLTATLRTDGASNFNPDHRWGYFPSVSLAWRFIEESFMNGTREILSNGKLRGGYGQTGNSNIGNRTLNYFGTGEQYAFGNTGSTGMKLTELGNENITWETTSEWNIGLDLGFLNNRINLSAEYYDRIVSDLLVTNKKLASYNEITTMAANIGKTRGRGLELTLNTVNVQRKNFLWTSDFTFFTYEDRWEERDPDWVPAPYQSAKDPIRAVFNYRSDGLLQPGETVPAWQKGLLPGQIKLKKLDKDSEILGQKDMEMIGTNDPKFTFGFNNTLRYKDFDLNIYLYGEIGRLHGPSYYDDWIPYNYYAPQDKGLYNGSKNALNSWTMDKKNATIPNILTSNVGGGAGDYFIKEISFLRCRNITLGYIIPISKKIVNSLRITATVNNPFLISNYNGLDPETDYDTRRGNDNSIGNYSYPNVRTYSLGIDIKF
ncbi:SusC/RagA family TonB-linked outer membrane protein [Bacteroidia bacterium]|nr:SusC/RagA family TonB-linked outer membrane protein [Bacteroidia bacterium]